MYIFKTPTVKLKLQKLWGKSFSLFLKCAGKDNFKELSWSLLTHKVVHFQAAICFVRNHSLHGILIFCKL